MNKKSIFVTLLLLSVAVLTVHPQHPLVPKDVDGDLDLRCVACVVHGKVVVSDPAPAVFVPVTPDRIHETAPISLSGRTPAPRESRAPPLG